MTMISSTWEWRAWRKHRYCWWEILTGAVFLRPLYGTVKLLPEDEQADDQRSGRQQIPRGCEDPGAGSSDDRGAKTEIPVVGVVPMERLDIDDEDSLSDRLEADSEGSWP